MRKMMVLGFAVIVSMYFLPGCVSSQDIVDDSGNKVGEVEVTENEDGSTSTKMSITMGENAGEGEPCSSDGECGMGSKCIHGTCVEMECTFLSDCDESADLCYQGHCMTEEELFERFDRWEVDRMCSGACENCKSGEFKSTMTSGRNDTEYRICTDCWDDNDCVEGTWCDLGKCVKE